MHFQHKAARSLLACALPAHVDPTTPMLQVTSLGRVVPAAKGKAARAGKGGTGAPYCHLACALWVPEVELSDVPNMAGVRLDKLTAVRVKLRCELCKQTGGAAV